MGALPAGDPFEALSDPNRRAIVEVLGRGDRSVREISDALPISRPAVSRHLRLLTEGGVVERFREGTWAFFRLAEGSGSADLARRLLDHLDPTDPIILRDRERLAAVRGARAAAAQAYFSRHAAEWDRIRELHVADAAVEEAIQTALSDRPFRSLLDLGTGTGRMLELFGSDLERGRAHGDATAVFTWQRQPARADAHRAGLAR